MAAGQLEATVPVTKGIGGQENLLQKIGNFTSGLGGVSGAISGIGGAISSIDGIIDTMTGLFGGKTKADKQNDFAREMYEKQIADQKEMNKDSAALNFEYGEKGAEAQMKRAIDYYNSINSPVAMRKQYEDANLSAALMYGGSGTSGTSQISGSAGNAGNQHGQINGGMEVAAMGLQLKKQEAEINLMNAQAAAARSTAGKTTVETSTSSTKASEETMTMRSRALRAISENTAAAGVAQDNAFYQAMKNKADAIFTAWSKGTDIGSLTDEDIKNMSSSLAGKELSEGVNKITIENVATGIDNRIKEFNLEIDQQSKAQLIQATYDLMVSQNEETKINIAIKKIEEALKEGTKSPTIIRKWIEAFAIPELILAAGGAGSQAAKALLGMGK